MTESEKSSPTSATAEALLVSQRFLRHSALFFTGTHFHCLTQTRSLTSSDDEDDARPSHVTYLVCMSADDELAKVGVVVHGTLTVISDTWHRQR